jgi:hypothetical protein
MGTHVPELHISPKYISPKYISPKYLNSQASLSDNQYQELTS